MAAIKVNFKSDNSEAVFDGILEPVGSSGYTFSGTLSARCKLSRLHSGFNNVVRLGHGGTSGDYSYLDFDLKGLINVHVEGSGSRASNETVDFRLGFNEGISGQFYDGDKATVISGGPFKEIEAFYFTKDAFDKISYDIRFNGKARADGPTGFVIEGTLSAYFMDGALTTQYARIGYKNDSGSWSYQNFGSDEDERNFKIFGSRKMGEKIQIVVGSTSQVFNLYAYGAEVSCELPELF